MHNSFLCRGQRLDNSDWVYGLVHEKVVTFIGKSTFWPVIQVKRSEHDREDYFVNPETVSRCTGLSAAKSYRGAEPEDLLAFEGDIVRQTKYGYSPHEMTVINTLRWQASCCSHVIGIGTCGEGSGDFVDLMKPFEIIGSIYDAVCGSRCDSETAGNNTTAC